MRGGHGTWRDACSTPRQHGRWQQMQAAAVAPAPATNAMLCQNQLACCGRPGPPRSPRRAGACCRVRSGCPGASRCEGTASPGRAAGCTPGAGQQGGGGRRGRVAVGNGMHATGGRAGCLPCQLPCRPPALWRLPGRFSSSLAAGPTQLLAASTSPHLKRCTQSSRNRLLAASGGPKAWLPPSKSSACLGRR